MKPPKGSSDHMLPPQRTLSQSLSSQRIQVLWTYCQASLPRAREDRQEGTRSQAGASRRPPAEAKQHAASSKHRRALGPR